MSSKRKWLRHKTDGTLTGLHQHLMNDPDWELVEMDRTKEAKQPKRRGRPRKEQSKPTADESALNDALADLTGGLDGDAG